MRYIFSLFLIFLILSGCKNNYEPESRDIKIATVKLPPKQKLDNKDKILLSEISQKIIKSAELNFETDDLEKTYSQIQKALIANKGSVLKDYEGKDYGRIYRNLAIKVPSQNFDVFINDISKGVSYFEQKEISAEDVTEEFIDLTSRLKTKKKLEERYLEILKKANKVSEILEIEEQISTIREEIEAKEGKLKYLESRISESTIKIQFYKTIAEKEGVKISYGSKLWNAVKSGFFSLSDFLISLISIWPFVIIFCVLAYFIRKRFKRRKKE